MECSCLRQTELPHTSRLFADLVYRPDQVSSFYPHLPFPDFPTLQSSLQSYPASRRESLVRLLRRQNGEHPDLDRLAQPGTVAVMTGQQVGLFTGPAYTIYKALTAVKLARTLDGQGIPAVPVFWLATEDHDFEEINHASVFDADHSPTRLYVPSTTEANRPVGDIALGPVPAEELARGLQGLPFRDEIADRVLAAYRPDASFGQAFSRLLRDLLGPLGMLTIDPMDAGFRALAAPVMQKAVEQAPELTAALLRRNQELIAAGYHAQVHVEEHTALVFLLEEGKRIALRRSNGDYLAQGRRIPAAELASRAHELSPNALLRPVIQDFVLPTIAYIGGPAELAYLAQSQVLYQGLLDRQPAAVPRSGFTVLDARSRKLMTRYRIEIPDLFHGEEALREKVGRTLIPEHLHHAMCETHAAAVKAIDTLESQLVAFDPTLAKAAAKSRRKIEYQLGRIRRKTAAQILSREERTRRDASYVYNLVYPHKHLQERLYSILPFLAKHGSGLIDQLYDNIHLDCPNHKILVV